MSTLSDPLQAFTRSAALSLGSLGRLRRLVALCLLSLSLAAQAHDFSAGDMQVEHPFATPSTLSSGTVYLKRMKNRGSRADRLLGASTPVAARVELQAPLADAGGAMRLQAVPDIALAPGAELQMRPSRGAQLALLGLKQPLKDGDTFPMTLQFEHGGKVEVKVYVQQPR